MQEGDLLDDINKEDYNLLGLAILKKLMNAPPIKLTSKYPTNDPFPVNYIPCHKGDDRAAYLKSVFKLHEGEVRSCKVWEQTEGGKWVMKIRAWSLARLLESYNPTVMFSTRARCTRITRAG